MPELDQARRPPSARLTRRAAVRFAIVLAVTPVGSLGAQRPAAGGFGAIAGFVFDSSTGLPMLRASVCAYTPAPLANRGAARCVQSQIDGAYELDSLPPGRYFPWAMCEVFGGRPSVPLGVRAVDDSIRVDAGVTVEGAVFLMRDDSTCRQPPPVRFRRGVFRGRYVGGRSAGGSQFSTFRPCAADAWPTRPRSDRPASLDSTAWVTWVPRLELAGTGAEARAVEGPRHYFVRWRGVLVGPRFSDRYGSYSYELVVDSVLEMRPPGPHDCDT